MAKILSKNNAGPTHPMTWALVVEAVMNSQVYSCFSTDEEEVRKYEAKCAAVNFTRWEIYE